MCVRHIYVYTPVRTAPVEREEDIQHDDHAVEEWCHHQPRATFYLKTILIFFLKRGEDITCHPDACVVAFPLPTRRHGYFSTCCAQLDEQSNTWCEGRDNYQGRA